jgi:hypothetical protein
MSTTTTVAVLLANCNAQAFPIPKTASVAMKILFPKLNSDEVIFLFADFRLFFKSS